jgi:hypothetical protein
MYKGYFRIARGVGECVLIVVEHSVVREGLSNCWRRYLVESVSLSKEALIRE